MKNLFSYWPTAIVVAVIIYATLFPHPVGADALPVIPGIDKVVHAIMFGGLTGALIFDYARSHGRTLPSCGIAVLFALSSILAGGAIELLQDAMQLGRGADVYDFIADAAGASAAFFIAPPAVRAVLRRGR